MVLRVTLVKLESLGSKVPEAFQEPQAERENLEKVPMYTAQHSVWDWRDRSLSPMFPFALPRFSTISKTTMMAPLAKSADHIRVAHGFVRKYVRFTGHHFRVVKRIMTKMEHVAELIQNRVNTYLKETNS